MTLPINIVTMVCALFPVFLFLLLLIFRWGAAEAAPLAAFTCILLTFAVFKAPALLIAVEGSKGVWNGLVIMFLLWTAALMYRILKQYNTPSADEAGGQKGGDYRRTDVYRQIEAEREEDRQPVSIKEGIPAYAVMLCSALAMVLLSRTGIMAGFAAVGFDFPESGTGYGFVNEAVKGYSPLQPFLQAAVIMLVLDTVGLIALGVRGRLGHGSFARVFRKSFETALPGGIAVCALMLMLAVMAGCGAVYVVTSGAAREVSVMPAGFLMLIAAPLMYCLSEKRRIQKLEEEEAKMQASLKAGEIRAVKQARLKKKPKFYETRNGGLSIAFLVILVAFIFVMIGIWGSDETFTLDGFAAIITAMLYCPMRTFIFDRAADLI